ncbi:MAG: YbfB/YjiJ family MFS transporter [Acetobacteraceae bacterium]
MARATTTSPLLAAFAGLLALAVAIGVGRFVYTPILPLMVAALGLSKFTAGLLASANYAGYLAGAFLAAGSLPGSRRAWLLLSLLASVLTTAMMGTTASVALLLALRFVGGLASAFAFVFISTIVLELAVAAARPILPAVMYAGVGVGIVVSAALVSGLRGGGSPWSTLWFAAAALALAGTVAVATMAPSQTAAIRRRGPASGASHLTGPFCRLAAAYGLYGFGYVITATFLVALVRGNPALHSIEPIIWIIFGLASIPSAALWTLISRPLGAPRAFALALLVEAAGVLASVTWQTTAGVILAAILVAGTFMGIVTLALVRARRFARGDGRRELALMTATFGVGQIIGPAFAGALFDRLGSIAVPSWTAAGALALAAIVAIKEDP